MQLTKLERVQSRFIPAGYTEYRRQGDSVVYASSDHLHAIAYTGTSRKAVWYYRFMNEGSFLARVDQFFASMKGHKDRIEQRRKERQEFKTTLKPGDILHTSWGYDQTNVEFFQVLNVSNNTVQLREICQDYKETGFMSGQTRPIKDLFIEKAQTINRRVGPGEYVRIDDVRSAWRYEGGAHYSSSYA